MGGGQFLEWRHVEHGGSDPVVAELLDARLVWEVVNPAANVVHRGYVEGRVADRDLVEAVGREVLPYAVVGTVGGQVQARAGQTDLGARRLRHDRVGHVARAFADDPDHDHHADDGRERRQPRARSIAGGLARAQAAALARAAARAADAASGERAEL